MAWTNDQVSAWKDIQKNGTDVTISVVSNIFNTATRKTSQTEKPYPTKAIISILSFEEQSDELLKKTNLKIFAPVIDIPDLLDEKPENIKLELKSKTYTALKVAPVMPTGDVILYKLFFK